MPSKYLYLDRIILFISSVIIFIFHDKEVLSVLPILGALTFTSFLIVSDKNIKFRIIIYLSFFLLSIYFINMVYFMPLIIYDLTKERQKLFLLLPIIPFILFLQSYGVYDSLLLIILTVLAIFMCLKTMEIINNKSKFYNLIDDTKELTLQLNKINKNLIEKQDNDIHIATLNERNRIAREIHDHLGHQLSSAILQLGALLAISKDDTTKEPLNKLKETLNTGMDNIRQSIHNLYDTSIDLDTKLQELIKSFTFCPIELDNGIGTTLEQKQCYAIIAIIKEAFSNIIKHSNATNVSVVLREHPSFYQLIINDNGSVKSYNPDQGIGLKNMEQRIDNLNGHFQIRRSNGFEIFISLPKTE